MSKFLILKEFLLFIKTQKKWYLVPIILFLFLFGFIIVLAEGSGLAPFIYVLF